MWLQVKALLSRSGLLFCLLGLALAGLACWISYELQLGQQRKAYSHEINSTFQVVGQRMAVAEASLDALVGLYQASDDMDAALFTPFSRRILQEHGFLDSLEYLTYIGIDEKQQFVAEMHEAGFSQFEIRPLNGQSPGLDHFLVTSFLEPLKPSNAGLMGMDWLGDSELRQVIFAAARNNASRLLPAPAALGQPRHLVAIKPTYFGRSIETGAAERLEQFSGAFVILLDWNKMSLDAGGEVNAALPIDYTLRADDRTLVGETGPDADTSLRQAIDFGGQGLELVASHSLRASRSALLNVALAGMLTAFLYCVLLFELRSRYSLKRESDLAQSQLFKERERAEVTLRSIGDAVITTELDHCINYMNPVAEELLNCRLEDARGRHITELVKLEFMPFGDEISDPVEFYVDMTQSNLRQTGIDVVMRVKAGRISVDGNASPLFDSNGAPIGSLLVLRDVSLEQELTAQLVYQASHDSLTGLINRAEFENRVKDALETSRQRDNQHALCYIDMDQFKLVNDTCGHIAGDELLKQVAGLLQAQIPHNDVVARLGGDEFGLLLENCGPELAEKIAGRVREALHDMHFKWDEKLFDVSASIGLVMINRMSGSLSDILSAADLACYAAKDSGRDLVHVYRVDDEEIAQKYSQMQWLPRIKEAIKNDEFELAVQDVVPIKSGLQPTAISEFLLRWPQNEGGLISPGLFIPTAERYDLMRDLDWWVINRALATIPQLELQLAQPDDHMYTINLSGQSVGDPQLADYIIEKMNDYAVDPRILCFEVTETVAIANFSVAIEFISRLREMGCRFALDDFGSGLSSFGYLKRLPLDFLKIDGQFVRDMLNDPVDLAMVRTIYDVARVLKLQTIAEWVEDEGTLESLQSIGIDYAQGFHLAKPVMVSELLDRENRRIAQA